MTAVDASSPYMAEPGPLITSGIILRISANVRYPRFFISSAVITVTILGALLTGVSCLVAIVTFSFRPNQIASVDKAYSMLLFVLLEFGLDSVIFAGSWTMSVVASAFSAYANLGFKEI